MLSCVVVAGCPKTPISPAIPALLSYFHPGCLKLYRRSSLICLICFMTWRVEACNIIKCLRNSKETSFRLYAFTAIAGISARTSRYREKLFLRQPVLNPYPVPLYRHCNNNPAILYPLYTLPTTSLIRCAVFGPMDSTSISSSGPALITLSTLPKCCNSLRAATGPILDMEDIIYFCCSLNVIAVFLPWRLGVRFSSTCSRFAITWIRAAVSWASLVLIIGIPKSVAMDASTPLMALGCICLAVYRLAPSIISTGLS